MDAVVSQIARSKKKPVLFDENRTGFIDIDWDKRVSLPFRQKSENGLLPGGSGQGPQWGGNEAQDPWPALCLHSD